MAASVAQGSPRLKDGSELVLGQFGLQLCTHPGHPVAMGEIPEAGISTAAFMTEMGG
jgi:hypothetical protein